MPSPYHVRLAVSQAGDQFRAELFTEDLGDTEGDVLPELPPSVGEWLPFLAQGADLPPDAARKLGKDLFAALLGQPENAKKWTEVLERAAAAGQPVRLLIDATSEAVRDLPYGLLCEPHDDWFVFRAAKPQAVRFVRILRRCSPRPLDLGSRPRVLVAVAEPTSPDVPPFAAADRLKALCDALKDCADVRLCAADGVKPLAEIAGTDAAAFAPFTKTTREALKAAVAGEFDVVHLLAHGHGAGVLLCTPAGGPAETTAGELAGWCGAGKAGLAFLQVCKAGQTADRGGFGGVAQQLLSPHGGNFAAVVASTFPLDAERSTSSAAAFYKSIAAGQSPEEALAGDGPEADWCWAFLELWARPGALGGTRQRAAFQFVSPYRGLSSYTERDADLFFGRRAEVTELLHILQTEPAVGVVGDSGSGKTSLLQAGLVHAVRENGLAGSDRWRIVSLRPGYAPVQTLLAALGSSGATLAAALRADDRPLLLIFDQFEELFTLARDPDEGRALTAALADLVAERPDQVRLVIGMRSEFLGQSAGLPGLSRLLRRPWVLRPPDANDVRDIVAGPAAACGYTFQGPQTDGNPAHAVGLLDRILADPLLATTEGAAPSLPLLQFALERLWLKAVEDGRTEFTHAGYDALGGLGTAIAQHAEGAYQACGTATGLGVGGRDLAEAIFTGLVNTRGTRQPRKRADLEAETRRPADARAVTEYLVGERLLTVRADPTDPAASLLDLAHEALIRHWDRLRGWLAEDPTGRAMREEFRTAAEKWAAGYAGIPPKSHRALPAAEAARNYLAWVDTHRPQLPPAGAEFVAAIRADRARQRRLRQAVMAGFAILAVTASALAIYAAGKARLAQQSEKNALREAVTLTLARGVDLCERARPRFGLLSLAHSLQICPPDAADLDRVIRTNLAAWAPHVTQLDDAYRFRPTRAASADGGVVLAERDDGAHQLFDTRTREPVGKPMAVGGDLSPWGRLIPKEGGWYMLIRGADFVDLWDTTNGQPVGDRQRLDRSDDGETYTADFSPDSRVLAVGTSAGKVILWDLVGDLKASGAAWVRRGQPLNHEGSVNDLTFVDHGRLLLTGCDREDRTKSAITGGEWQGVPADQAAGFTRLWKIPPESNRHELAKIDKTYGADEEVTVVGAKDGPDEPLITYGNTAIHVWNRKTNQRVGPPLVEPGPVAMLGFHPREKATLVVTRVSGLVGVHNRLAPDQPAEEELPPQGPLARAGVRPDNSLYTMNRDGTLRIWRKPKLPDPHTYPDKNNDNKNGPVLSVALSPDDQTVATGCRDGSVYLYQTDTKQLIQKFTPKRGKVEPWEISRVRFSSDGNRVIAQDAAYVAWVWEAHENGKPVCSDQTLLGVDAAGRMALAEGPAEGPVGGYVIINLDRPHDRGTGIIVPGGGIGPIAALAGDETTMLRVARVAFSPDGRLIGVTGQDNNAHVFRTADGTEVGQGLSHSSDAKLRSHFPIDNIAFSPDSRLVLTRNVRAWSVWEAETGASVVFQPDSVGVQLARFSPDGRFVFAGTNYNMTQIWDVGARKFLPTPLHHPARIWEVTATADSGRVLTANEDSTARSWDTQTGKPLSRPLQHPGAVNDAVFSRDASRILTGSRDGNARLWHAPRPVEGEVERLTLWVETLTGMRIGGTQASDLLSATDWVAKRERLNQLGGPPDAIK